MTGIAAELVTLVDDVIRRSEDDASLWATLTELGLHLVGVPEAAGGAGADLADLAVVVQALGGHGRSTPLVEVATAAWAVRDLSDRPEGLGTVAVARERVAGAVRAHAPWGRSADWAVLLGPNGVVRLLPSLDEVSLEQGQNLAGEPLDELTVDEGRTSPRPELAGFAQIGARLGLLRSAALLGAGQAAAGMTRDYVGARHQFGRPLADIPAVRSSFATMSVALSEANAAYERAREIVGTRNDDAALAAVAAARIVTAQAATDIARTSHQLHGAIGVTAEYPLSRLTRRLWAWRDADVPARDWAVQLGERAVSGGEPAFWDSLTA